MNPSRFRWLTPILIIAAQILMLRVGLESPVINNLWLLVIVFILARFEKQIWAARKDLEEVRLLQEIKGN